MLAKLLADVFRLKTSKTKRGGNDVDLFIFDSRLKTSKTKRNIQGPADSRGDKLKTSKTKRRLPSKLLERVAYYALKTSKTKSDWLPVMMKKPKLKTSKTKRGEGFSDGVLKTSKTKSLGRDTGHR